MSVKGKHISLVRIFQLVEHLEKVLILINIWSNEGRSHNKYFWWNLGKILYVWNAVNFLPINVESIIEFTYRFTNWILYRNNSLTTWDNVVIPSVSIKEGEKKKYRNNLLMRSLIQINIENMWKTNTNVFLTICKY